MIGNSRKISLHISVIVAVLTVFMLILSVQTFAASGTVGKAQVNSRSGVCLRKSSSVNSKRLAVIPDNTEMTIYKEVYKSKTSTVKKNVWYYVQVNGKKGYVRSDNVDNVRYPSVNAKVTSTAYYRKGPGTRMKKRGTLKKGTAVTVYMEANPVNSTRGRSKTWYKISANGKSGYICSKNIKLGTVKAAAASSKPAAAPKPAAPKTSAPKPAAATKPAAAPKTGNAFSKMTSAEFEKYLTQQGFPESYKPALRKLHAAHPNWVFTAYQTGITWTDAMKKETKFGVSLVSASYPTSYRSTSRDSYSSYKMAAAEPETAPAAETPAAEEKAPAKTAATFEEVRSALTPAADSSAQDPAELSVAGTVKSEKAVVVSEAKTDAPVLTELTRESTVSIKGAVVSTETSEKAESEAESAQSETKTLQWYQIEIITEKDVVDGSFAYDSSSESVDSELEAANEKAEQEIIGSDKEDGEASSEDGENSEQDEKVPVSVTGYVRAEDIEVILDTGSGEAVSAEENTEEAAAATESAETTETAEPADTPAEDENVQMTAAEAVLGPAGSGQTDDEAIAQNAMITSDETILAAAEEDTASICGDGEESLERVSGGSANAYYQVERGWYNANANVVAYFMDPRNFLNEDRIYMFEDLSYRPEYQTESVVRKIISPTKLASHGFSSSIFMNAGKKYNISPVFLAARVVQETGGNSASVNGSKSGGTVVYNPFNIGASGSNPVANGLAYAKKMGWTTPAKSVNGAAQYIASGYINKKQNSIYFQRFNVANGLAKVGTHQYMTNTMAPYSEAYITKKSYAKMGITGESFAFVIPVYKNMPAKTRLP